MQKITFKGKPVTLSGKTITVNTTAPEFTLTGKDLNAVKLSDFKGKVKVLSVFPSIDTGTCATQTRTFNKNAAALSHKIVILSISKDLPFAQSRFCGAEGIDKVVMLSDYRSNDFGAKYGFLIDELGLLTRGVVVIDKNDQVKYVEYVPEVTKEPDYDKALAVAKSLV